MLKIPETLPVRTRLPLAAWAVAAVVTLVLAHVLSAAAPQRRSDHAMPSAEQGVAAAKSRCHQAKV